MCIFVQDNKLKVAEEDIICYKVLKRKSLYDSTPVSPYHNEMEWDFDKVFTAPIPKWKIEYDEYHKGWFSYDGLFYSYNNYTDAYELMVKLSWGGAKFMYMIVKCTIPKGTYYYDGIQGSPEEDHDLMMQYGEYTYASKQLIINDIID